MPRPHLGTRLGKYLLLEPIGRGAMGVVYKAWHEELAKTVALKVMSRPDLDASVSSYERFQLEARAAARLSHPNLVSVLDAGVADGWHYFTMEYVEGETLQDRIERGCLDPMEAARIGEQIALALAHAHGHGVIHRDVKPQNILLPPDGGAKLADFGLAKDVHAGSGPTLAGQVLGTPNYMAPEQASGNVAEIDGRSDLFSLGAVLYECVTGHVPFDGSNVAEIIDQIRAREPRPMRFHSAVLSPEFEAIVFQCMEKDKRRRYQRADDLVEDLQRFRRGEMVQARRQTLIYRLRRRARKNWRIVTFVAAVLLAAAGAVALVERASSRKQAVVTRKDEVIQLVHEAERLSRDREASSVNDAIARCDKAVADPPNDDTRTLVAQAYFLRAVAHRRRLELEQAKKDFAEAIRLDEGRDDARYEAALAEMDLGRTQTAEDLLGQVAEKGREGNIVQLMAKARLSLLQSKKRETSPQLAADLHAEADRCLDEAEKKDPLFPDQYLLRGSLVGWYMGYGGNLPQPPFRKADLGAAVKHLDQALMVDPLSLPARLSRGEDLRRLERDQEAVRDFDAALELAPDDARVYFLRARAYSALRLYDFSLADLQQAVRLHKTEEVLAYRGVVRMCLGDNAGALADAQEAYALSSTNPETLFLLAVCLSLSGEEQRSRELAKTWAKGESPFFRQVRTIDLQTMDAAFAPAANTLLRAANKGMDDYFGVEPAIKKPTYVLMRTLVARQGQPGRSSFGLKELMEQLGSPNDLVPPEVEDMLLRVEEGDPRQQNLLRASNAVLASVGIRTPLQTLVQVTRFVMKFHDLRALVDRSSLTDAQDLYRRGCLRYFKGDRDSLLAARSDFRKAVELRPSFSEALFGLAATAAHLKFTDECLEALRRLKRCGFAHWGFVQEDPDLSPVQDDPEFSKLFQE